jgi:MarR family 2-MHQ and catechol resistance regulon transcriptional repressor
MKHMEAGYSGPEIRDLLRRSEWNVSAAERMFIRKNHCLGQSDFSVLNNLSIGGSTSISVLGGKVLLTSGSITTAVDRLENRGFVVRRPDPRDRRISVVELTLAGREVIETGTVGYSEMLETVFSPLSEIEKSQLTHILKKLGGGQNGGKIR